MKEQSILHRILLACGSGTTRLFRVNVGVAWAGKGEPRRVSKPTSVVMQPGDVLLRAAQPIRMGLCVGSSDIVGWKSRVMQPDDVGTRIAIFTAIEVKAAGGRVRPEQQVFIDQVQAAGGIAGIARSETDAAKLIDG
jgi:VRR-NUC domain.